MLFMASRTRGETVFKTMRLAICSGNRRDILLKLHDGQKSLGDLRDELQSDSATIVHSLRELEHAHLVEENDLRNYVLTIIGKAIVQKVIDCQRLADVLTSLEAFWFAHDITGIPEYLFGRIGSLQGSTLVADREEHVLSGLETFIALLESTRVVKLLTPFYSYDFVSRLDVFASKDIEWDLIVTEAVLQSALKDRTHPNVKAILEGEGQIRTITQDPKLFFVSTGREIALALDYLAGQLDYSTLLLSRESDAILWGHELFSFYAERSKPAVLQ